jgi:16S rRNA processing protein RimM
MILMAIITSAHGLRGAVKVKTFTQSPETLFAYGALRDEKGQEYLLKEVKFLSPDSLIVTIEGVQDRTQAESLRGTKLYVDRDQLPNLEEEEFYHTDLMGLLVQDLEGQDIGHVRAVSNFGAGDFLEIVAPDHHLYTIPFTKEAVPLIQLQEGKIQINRFFLLDSALTQKDLGDLDE